MDAAPLGKDELAAAYLKSRDLPCPSCGYNRRDGQTSICPECEHDLAIVHEDGGWKHKFRLLALRHLMLVIVISVGMFLLWSYRTYVWLSFVISGGQYPNVNFYLIHSSVGVISQLVILLICIRRWRAVRSDATLSPTYVASPMLIYVIVTVVLEFTINLIEFL